MLLLISVGFVLDGLFSGVLVRKIFQNCVSKSRLPDSHSLAQRSDYSVQIWESGGSYAVSHPSAIGSVVHMSAFFLGIRPAF